MKLSSLITLAFATVVVSELPIGKCDIVKYPGVLDAINKFCSRQDLTVPSKYAGSGRDSGFPWPKAHVEIYGNCGPPQWVPQKYCVTQFQNMCANKRTQQRFGRNGCQIWKINYDQKKKKPKCDPVRGCNVDVKTINFRDVTGGGEE